jgi:hypothetical protein
LLTLGVALAEDKAAQVIKKSSGFHTVYCARLSAFVLHRWRQ